MDAKRILMLTLITFSLNAFSQNIMQIPDSISSLMELEEIMMKIRDIYLMDSANGAYVITGIKQGVDKDNNPRYTYADFAEELTEVNYVTSIDYKVNENLNYHFIVSPVPNSEYVDVMFSKLTYGDTTGVLRERVQKKREYMPINRRIESVRLSNGFTIFMGDKIFVATILTPNRNLLMMRGYRFPY